MASTGISIPMVNGAAMHLPPGYRFRPTEEVLIVNYLYPRALHMPLPCEIIADINILQHHPSDIVPEEESQTGKHFFTRKTIKYPGGHRSNRVVGNGSWRATGSEVPIYCKLGNGANNMLVGMRRTLVFYNGKSQATECMVWAMHEFRLAGVGLLPRPMMRQTTGDGLELPNGYRHATITKRNNGLSATNQGKIACARHVTIMVEPDSSWLICHVYKKRQRAPRVVFPRAIDNAIEGQVRFVDFLGHPSLEPSSPHSCIIDTISTDDMSDESVGGNGEKDGDSLYE
uniref:NAC domain-containing protein n=1 Tax=Leersia perrieri TaxID=77586 RepID=A0A0D9XRL7_9ORYZ